MKKMLFVIFSVVLLSGVILAGIEARAAEAEFAYKGELRFLGWYWDFNGGQESFAEMRARPRFDVNVGDVKSVIRFEIGDSVIGKGESKAFDFGADETIIEVKQAYLDIPLLGPARFRGGVFGYVTPGSFVIDEDVPGFHVYADINGIDVDLTWLKEEEGSKGSGVDDITFTTIQASMPVGSIDVNPAVTLGTRRYASNYVIYPAISASSKLMMVDVELAAAGAFGKADDDVNASAFAAKLNASTDMSFYKTKGFWCVHQRRQRHIR